LAIALFFKFSRLLSVRNWDVLALFLLVPGLLLRQEANARNPEADVSKASPAAENGQAKAAQNTMLWYGYLWLLCGSAYLLVRCLGDWALGGARAFPPTLNSAGLVWFGLALLLCFILKPPVGSPEPANGTTGLVWTHRITAILCQVSIVSALT